MHLLYMIIETLHRFWKTKHADSNAKAKTER